MKKGFKPILIREIKAYRELKGAIRYKQLELYYQPKVELRGNRIVGYEALIRWNKNGKIISPLEFIPFAERSGVIMEISRWVVEEAVTQIKYWQIQDIDMPISINISAGELYNGDIVQHIKRVTNKANINPNLLGIEITESIAMEDINKAIEIIDEIKKLGVGIAIDDFGTGYSSLSYLKRFPINEVKLDQSFIRDLTENDYSKTLVKGIIELIKSLELEMIAEGIETMQQQELLLEMGCKIGQGYLYGMPMKLSQLS